MLNDYNLRIMPKSKTKNRKRSRKLKQRKNTRDRKKEVQTSSKEKIKARLQKQLNEDVALRDKSQKGKKISEVVLEMLQPFINEAQSHNEEKEIIDLGIIAWNLGVISTYLGKEEMEQALKEIKSEVPEFLKEIILILVELKTSDYDQYDKLILDYEYTRFNKTRNNLTVTYKTINE